MKILLLQKGPYAGLSYRSAHCCIKLGLEDKEQIKKAIYNGTLHYKGIHKTKNLGVKSYIEICEWLEIDYEGLINKNIKTCPHCGGRIEIAALAWGQPAFNLIINK